MSYVKLPIFDETGYIVNAKSDKIDAAVDFLA